MIAQSVPDDILVAHLDGRLSLKQERELDDRLRKDPTAAARMAQLKSTSIDFAAALGGRRPLCPPDLIASIETLLDQRAGERALLSRASVFERTRATLLCRLRHAATAIRRPGFAPGALIGAAIGAALAMALALSMVGLGGPGDPTQPAGVAAVASQDEQFINDIALYQAFYSKETVASAPLTDDQRRAGLELVGDRLERDWREADLAVDGLKFRRAQILTFGVSPVAQIILADADGEPFALCVTATASADRAIRIENRHGMAVASWVEQGKVYVTAARPALPQFEQASRKLVDRLS
jgi:anti-sigma factor RsiW